jgi:hypothetical protein
MPCPAKAAGPELVTLREGNMKRTIAFPVCILVGIGIGWFLAHICSTAKGQQKLAEQYQALQITNRRDDDITSAIVLKALRSIEGGNTNQAEQVMLETVVLYYRIHHDWGGGNKDVLAQINVAVNKYPALSAELARETKLKQLTE